MQNLHGRRGAVFSVRVTGEDRAALEAIQSKTAGPRALGPWLVWRALAGASPNEILPPRGTEVLPRRRKREARGGSTVAIAKRTILDLCAGSGSWSLPYERAGYKIVRVTLPEHDVRTFRAPPNVWGVLAAPPCDQFSLARNGHDARSPRDLVRGLETVSACLRIISVCKPKWWALENPVGLLSKWLGTARDVFDPCDFGDPWTKRTAIWGEFQIPRRGPFVKPLGGGPFCSACPAARRKTTWCNNAAHRAITPAGFARAFFEANP